MKIVFLLSLALFISACTHSGQKLNQDVVLTPSLTAQKYTNIYFSAQPHLEDFQALRSKGFATIINLRQSKEDSYSEADERKVAERAQFNYVHIPMSGKEPLTDEIISKVTKAVVDHRSKGKVLIHCSTGNRAALWGGGHFYKDHGYSKEDSMKVAKQLGLNEDVPLKNLENYLENKE